MMDTETLPNVYILYNAKASVLGKIDYVYRKWTCPPDTQACGACQLTHGGLRLNETDTWKKAKSRINANVTQLHIDELTPQIKQFAKETSLSYPAVLAQEPEGPFKLLLNAQDLESVSKDHEAFLKQLVESGERENVKMTLRS